MKLKELELKAAKAVRIISIPPITVSLLVLTLGLFGNVYTKTDDIVMTLLCLAIIPILSYPFCFLIPALRRLGRSTQRKFAFIFSAVGYISGILYALFSKCNKYVLFVFAAYFGSLIALIFFNKFLKIRASGHACAIAGPILIASVIGSPFCLLPGIILYAVIFRASIITKRHTVKEYIFGTLCSLASVLISLLILLL